MVESESIKGLNLVDLILPAPEGDSRLLLRLNEWVGVDPVDEKNRLRRHRLLCGIPAQIGGRFHPDIPQGDRIIKPITPAVVLDVLSVLHLMDEQVFRNRLNRHKPAPPGKAARSAPGRPALPGPPGVPAFRQGSAGLCGLIGTERPQSIPG